MRGFSRRSILKMGATAVVGAAVPFVRAANAQSSGTTLRVATWGGSWRDSIEKNVSSRLAAKRPRHSAAVARYARAIAEAAGCSPVDQDLAHTAGLLHDIGKFILPDHILLADTKLGDDDWNLIKMHPYQGSKVVLVPCVVMVSSVRRLRPVS